MHILIVAPEQIPVPPMLGGSVEICIWAIARELAKQHQVTVISRSHARYPKREFRCNVRMVRVRTGSQNTYIANVLRAVQGQSFDLIQVDNRPRFIPRIKERFPDTPVTLFLHSLTFVSGKYISRSHAESCLRRADAIVANSRSLKQRLSHRFPEQAGKITTVALGVDTSRFRPLASAGRKRMRKRKNLKHRFVVLYTGRLIPRKGIPVLIRAAAKSRRRIPHLMLVIAGGGKASYIRRLKRLARQMKVPLRYAGIVPHGRIHSLYQTADCFVCPSQKHEAFGLVNVEAMACGIPVVASHIGGIPEIIRHQQNGYMTADYKNPGAFAEQLISIYRKPSNARRIAHKGRQDAVERFGWRHVSGSLMTVYQQLLRTGLHSAREEGNDGQLHS